MSPGQIACVAAVGYLTAVWACCAGYVTGSFLLTWRHAKRRRALVGLREAARELFWTVLIEPWLPLFYALGRRMGGADRGVPVVLVHGYTQNRVNFVGLALRLSRAGLGPLFGFNYRWTADVRDSALRLARFVERVRRETGSGEVDLVCHSLGGLVAVEYVSSGGGDGVRRCVTISTPHAGIAWRGPVLGACGEQMRRGSNLLARHAGVALGAAWLSIYSAHDNVVQPPSTSSIARRGGEDVVVEQVGHLSILFSARVAEQVVRFLSG
jgi:pimeloyl-ACP methyl ester carboxylesterase